MGQHGKIWREKGEERSDYELKKKKKNPMVHTSTSPRPDGTLQAKKSFQHVQLGLTHSLNTNLTPYTQDNSHGP